MIERGDDLLHLAAVGFDDERLALVIDVHIAEDAPLRIEQERIHALANGEIANVIRNHAV